MFDLIWYLFWFSDIPALLHVDKLITYQKEQIINREIFRYRF